MLRTVVLSVEESKVDGLLDALTKRPYITVVSMDREGRKRLRTCPCCKERIKKERPSTIDEKMLRAMFRVIRGMSVSKTVILTNKDTLVEEVPHIERERCVEFEVPLLEKAESLGLLKPFIDGARKTYFTDALDFFLNEEPHSPALMVTLQGELVETSGSMFFDEVKLKDEKSRDQLKREFRDAIKKIPDSTITFVKSGQLSLV
jgi:hypothetical protein